MRKKTLLKVIKRLKHYIPMLILSILFAALSVIMQLYIPILIGEAVDTCVDAGKVDLIALKPILVTMILVTLFAGVLQWLMNLANNKMTYGITRDIRNEAIKKLEKLPLSYLDAHSSGDTVSRIIADVDQFADGLLMGFTQLFTGLMTIVGTLVFMLKLDVKIALVVVLVTPLSLFVAAFIAKNTYHLFKKQSETRGEQTALIDEMIGGKKVVTAFNYEDRAIERFDEINERLKEASLKATFFSSLTNPCTRFVNNIVYLLVGVCGGFVCIKGGMTIGNLSSFLSYANQYTKPFNEISGVITELQNALVCAARVFEFIESEPEVANVKDAIVLTDETVTGEVDFSDVFFSYVKDKKLIEDLDVKVKPGQRVAIVGPTGAGKSTIINLLMRFYDVDKGTVSVSGHDIRNVKRESLRESFGMVLQETWLRSGTVRENIAYGNPNATEEEIIAAAKSAHAHSFIMRMKDGYDTVIDEDGENLSHGEKQLLCIARVMLNTPPMLILDEATSSIDTRTEVRIQRAFNKLMNGRTSFIVAHRLSTIREADIILVMKDGHVIEQGDHDSLLKADGFYAKLYNSQWS